MSHKVTVVITTYNQKSVLKVCLKVLKKVKGIGNIIIVDMKSTDGTRQILPDLGYDYILVEEKDETGYAQAWNTVISNFNLEEVVVFMKPQYFPGKECFIQLSKALMADNVGLAGPLSNGFRINQYLEIPETSDLEEVYYIEGLQQNGILDYKAMGLYSGLWAVKKKGLEYIGLFQSDLMSPEHVLIDYQLRMLQKGYQTIVCQRAVAYDCIGGLLDDYDTIYKKQDLEKLRKKWKIHYLNFTPNNYIVNLIQEKRNAAFKVLEIGCNMGATLLEIQNRYPNCKAYGMDINGAAVNVANYWFEAKVGDIEKKNIPFEEKFDYIILADVLEHLRIPDEVIGYCRENLNENGYILSSIPNVMNIKVIEQMLLNGRFTYTDEGLLDRTHIHLFTYYEIKSMFEREKYSMRSCSYTLSDLTEEQLKLIEKLSDMSEKVEPFMYQAHQYLVKAQR